MRQRCNAQIVGLVILASLSGCVAYPEPYFARIVLQVPILSIDDVQVPFIVHRHGMYRIVFKVPLPVADEYSRDILANVLREPASGIRTPQFQFSWRIADSKHVAAAGRGADGITSVILYGRGGFGSPPYTASGGAIGSALLDPEVPYSFKFTPALDFAPLLRAAPIIQIDREAD
jgi:hypothetical protein